MNFYDSAILFKIYLTIAASLMIFISIVVTAEVWKIIKILLLISTFDYIKQDRQVYLLSQALQLQCMWLSAITLLEYCLKLRKTNRGMYNLALCYQKLDFFNIALYYYTKISETSSYFLEALKNMETINKTLDI